MDYAKLKQYIINMLAIRFDQTGYEEMEIAEIASHLKVPIDHVKKTIFGRCRSWRAPEAALFSELI